MDLISVFWTIILLFFWSSIMILVFIMFWIAVEKIID